MLLSVVCEDYLRFNTAVKSPETRRLMRLSARHFSAFLQNAAIAADLTDSNIIAYVQHRRTLGKADTTIEREVAKLYTLANWCCQEGYIKPLRSKPFRSTVHPPIGFSSRELQRLFDAAHHYDTSIGGVPGNVYLPAIVYTLWDSLERSGAIWCVERTDIELGRVSGWIAFRHRKGGGRVLHRRLRWRTVRYLARLLAAHKHKQVFGMGLHRTSLYHHWGRLLMRAGITHDRYHGPHCLRRTGSSRYQLAGGRAQDVLDHQDERTTRRHYLVPQIVGEPQPVDRLRDPFGSLARVFAWCKL